jgi:tellurite resistance protein TerB
MEHPLLKKLVTEVQRYQNKEFLKAAMAVCALSANSDDEISVAERYRIDYAIASEPALQIFDEKKATRMLDDFIFALQEDGNSAEEILHNKVHSVAGDHKKARTLMRVAYLIITADREIQDGEMQEFERLCRLLDLDPIQVWAQLSERNTASATNDI